jgi:anti-anti-sigma regulatory factor
MKSEIKKKGQSIVVNVKGKLDYETNYEFKEDLQAIFQETSKSKDSKGAKSPDIKQNKSDEVAKNLIIDMRDLEFVGSSGITQFIQTLKEVAQRTDSTAKIISASNDFKKVMRAYDEEEAFEFLDDPQTAGNSAGRPSSKANN